MGMGASCLKDTIQTIMFDIGENVQAQLHKLVLALR